jgi:hypothetical protein
MCYTLRYASLVWNYISSTDANKPERIQQKFPFVCFYRFFPYVPCSYTSALEKLGLHSLRKRRHHLHAFCFLVQVYRRLKSCTSLLKNVNLRVPTRSVRGFSMFGVCPTNKHCPPRCAYAANAMGKDLDIFALGAFSQSHFYST